MTGTDNHAQLFLVEMGFHKLFLPGLASNYDSPICASWVTGITGVSHHTQFTFPFCLLFPKPWEPGIGGWFFFIPGGGRPRKTRWIWYVAQAKSWWPNPVMCPQILSVIWSLVTVDSLHSHQQLAAWYLSQNKNLILILVIVFTFCAIILSDWFVSQQYFG
jgi:hypothetical protein